MDKNSLCRLCLCANELSHNLFVDKDSPDSLFEMIGKYLQISVSMRVFYNGEAFCFIVNCYS